MKIEEVWSRYRTTVNGYLRKKIANSSDVEDLLQEVLIKTYTKLHTLQSEKSIKPWLFRITRNAIADYYAYNAKVVEVDADALAFDNGAPPIEQMLAGCIEPFIDTLPEKQAHLLRAVNIQGHTQKTYAHDNQLNYSTVKSRMQLGREQLRERYEDCCRLTKDKCGRVIECEQKTNDGYNCC